MAAFSDVFETREDAKENTAMASGLTHGKPAPQLVDIRLLRGIDREARAYFSSKEGLMTATAMALLVASSTTRTIANFFIGFNRPLVPTKLFTSEDEAVAWLKTFLK